MSEPGPSASQLLIRARRLSGKTKSAMAEAAGTSRSALDAYESGQRIPRFDTLLRALRSSGCDLSVSVDPHGDTDAGSGDDATSLAAYASGLNLDDPRWVWRLLISGFVGNEFVPATMRLRSRLLAAAPPRQADSRWDSFLAALAEHLSFHADIQTPKWTLDERLQLDSFWWPVHGDIPTMRSAALAHSPASFKRRLILIDGRELPWVRR